MNKNSKPRICKILGVEVNQEWSIDTPYFNHVINRINADGDHEWKNHDGKWELAGRELLLVYAINNPEEIKRKSRWTKRDAEDAKAIKTVFLNAEPVARNGKRILLYGKDANYLTSTYNPRLLPSLTEADKPVMLDEILKGG